MSLEPNGKPHPLELPVTVQEDEYMRLLEITKEFAAGSEYVLPNVPVTEYVPPKIPATEFLKEAADQMAARAALRDNPEGERTARKIAEVFNALTGHKLTEVDAWTFLLIMKMVRGRSGKFHKDDGVDGCAYFALMAEADSANPERQ